MPTYDQPTNVNLRTIGSVCTGTGALDQAVAAALGGTRLAWVADPDPAVSALLAHRYPDVPNLGDLATVDWSEIRSQAGVMPSESPAVDVLTAGFPCQDVSAAGRGAGLKPGTRTGLWLHIVGIIDQLRPRLVVLENVRGLLNADADSPVEPCPWCVGDGSATGLRALGAVLGDLADLGYDAVWCVLPASDVGAPHRRERVFVAAASVRAATDAGRGGVQRRADDRGVSGEEGPGAGEGIQRERRRDPARDGGEVATDSRGEARRVGPGLCPDGPARLGGPRPDHGGMAAPDSRGVGRVGGSGVVGDRRDEAVGEQACGHARDGGGAPTADPGGAGRQGVVRAAPADAGRRDAEHRGRGPEQSATGRDRPAVADPSGDGWGEGWPESAGVVGGSDAAVGGDAAPDPDRDGFQIVREGPKPDPRDNADGCGEVDWADYGPAIRRDHGRPTDPVLAPDLSQCRESEDAAEAIDWAGYAPAIERWSRALGRRAPAPTVLGARGGRQLNPEFVEWMMGLPPGHVTGVPGLTRNQQLKILGNGVVPQQAEAAIRYLLPLLLAGAGAAA